MVRRINLIPPADRTRTTTDLGLVALLAVVIIAVFAIAFGYYLFHGTLADRQQELADVEQQASSLESQLVALQEYEHLQAQRAKMEGTVQDVYATRTLVSEVLTAIGLVVPDTVWFQNLALATTDPESAASEAAAPAGAAASTGSNKLVIEGNTYGFEDIAQALVRLQLVPSLSDVKLTSAGEVENRDIKRFSLEALVKNTQPADTPLPMSQVQLEMP